jgi:hypothetical protein
MAQTGVEAVLPASHRPPEVPAVNPQGGGPVPARGAVSFSRLEWLSGYVQKGPLAGSKQAQCRNDNGVQESIQ